MRFACVIGSRRNDADALAFENRERVAVKVQNDMTNVTVRTFSGQPVIALNRRLGRFADRVEIDRRFRS